MQTPKLMPWVESTTNEELKSHFDSWGQDPMIILDHLKNPSKWSIHALEPLESYVRDKVVLGMPSISRKTNPVSDSSEVGDSAHSMLPHLGLSPIALRGGRLFGYLQAQVSAKVLKIYSSLSNCSLILKLKRPTLP